MPRGLPKLKRLCAELQSHRGKDHGLVLRPTGKVMRNP